MTLQQTLRSGYERCGKPWPVGTYGCESWITGSQKHLTNHVLEAAFELKGLRQVLRV